MQDITIGGRSFVARAAQQGNTTPALWIYLDPLSPLGDDKLSVIAKYADKQNKAERAVITLTAAKVVSSDNVPVQPYYPSTIRLEATFDKTMPYADRETAIAEFVLALGIADVRAAIAQAKPVL